MPLPDFQPWPVGAFLEASLWNANTSTILAALAGRDGVIEREGSFRVLDGPDGNRYIGLPTGTTNQRPSSPAVAWFRYNTTLEQVEHWNGTAWESIGYSTDVVTFENLLANGQLGYGANQVATSGHTHNGIPLAPSGFAGIPQDGSTALSWNNWYDFNVTSYEYNQDSGSWTAIANSNMNTVIHTISSLTNGTAYTFQVRAVAGSTDGTASSSFSVTPGRPTAPRDFAATAGDTEAVLTWTAPEHTGGFDITGYEYEQDSGSWTAIANSAALSTFTVTGLTNDTEYSFRLRAVNSDGEGLATEAVTVTPVAAT